jgi:hypothetical protein
LFGYVVSVHELIVLNQVFGLFMSVLAEMSLYMSVALAIAISIILSATNFRDSLLIFFLFQRSNVRLAIVLVSWQISCNLGPLKC